METLMETLVQNDFDLIEDSIDVAVYAKDLNSGESETYTFVMDEQEILHERYNKNGIQTFSEKVSAKNSLKVSLMVSTVK